MSDFGRFFIPGPTEVRPEILAEQTRPMIGHRGTEMKELMAELQPMLQTVFRTERPVYVSTSSATGLMEAAARGGAERRVLSLVNGAFSERFAEIAEAVGLEVARLTVPWGAAHDPVAVAEALSGGDYDAVTVVHSETSTGVLNPVRRIAEAVHEAGALLLVDAVSSLGGSQVEPDAWGLDFTLTGSQKALALPPGISFGVAQENVLERARKGLHRSYYLDIAELDTAVRKHQTPGTPPISLLYALRKQLCDILAEGMEARWSRHRSMAETTWRWVEGMRQRGLDLDVVAPDGYRAEAVTCIRMPGDRGATTLVKGLKARGFVIAAGYGDEKDRMFRIGHMGDHTVEHVEVLLHAIEDTLREMGLS